MNHIIHNIAVILIFIGIILLTINLTKSYNKCPVVQQKNQNTEDQNTEDQDRPSKIFDKMFSNSDVWMGYADADTKDNNTVNQTIKSRS
jgi:hypothetical protein